MPGKFVSSAAAIFVGALFVVLEVTANPGGVPVSESPPLVCNTPNFRVEAQTGANGEFPKAAVCVRLSDGASVPGSEYGYTITSALNISHALFAVAATQNLVSTDPSGSSFVADAGAGDSLTGFLAAAVHEYSVRFNAKGTVYSAKICTEGPSKPRIGTALIRSGNKVVESCVIASPGIAGDVFQPVFQSQTALVAGGKCKVQLFFDGSGNVIDAQPLMNPDGTTCLRYEGPVTVTIGQNTGPLKNNTSPHGLTFGNGTTTCYGPPIPSTPRCICTAAPCP